MGKTVVEPLILMVCFWPVETGAWVVTCATGVEAGIWVVATTVGDAVGAVVATVVFVSFPVHPAANASMITATMLMVISKYELLFSFMVFDHPFNFIY
jgi:H+/Cl- antiporter ClcA